MSLENTKIILVRHGESQGNAIRQVLGHTDRDLSELGYKQAAATADFLASEHIDAIYSSDLQRAYNTAKPHAQMRGLQIATSPELREVFVGEWEGLLVTEILEKYGDAEYFERWLGDFGNYVLPGGESVWGAGERFEKEVRRISEMHRGQTVLIASHAAVIRSFWARIAGISRDDLPEALPFCSNAAYCVLELRGGSLVPIAYSCDEHLKDIGITEYKG